MVFIVEPSGVVRGPSSTGNQPAQPIPVGSHSVQPLPVRVSAPAVASGSAPILKAEMKSPATPDDVRVSVSAAEALPNQKPASRFARASQTTASCIAAIPKAAKGLAFGSAAGAAVAYVLSESSVDPVVIKAAAVTCGLISAEAAVPQTAAGVAEAGKRVLSATKDLATSAVTAGADVLGHVYRKMHDVTILASVESYKRTIEAIKAPLGTIKAPSDARP